MDIYRFIRLSKSYVMASGNSITSSLPFLSVTVISSSLPSSNS